MTGRRGGAFVGAPLRALVSSCLLGALAMPFGMGLGQAQPHEEPLPPPEFEELTVRRGGPRMPVVTHTKQRHVLDNASLKDLIGLAYPIPSSQIAGGPEWIDSYGFDIVMVLKEEDADRAQALRYVLAERFDLAVHFETKPVYVLEAQPAGMRLRVSSARSDNAVASLEESPGRIAGEGMTSKALASALSRYLQRPVLDHTALQDRYDVVLEWPLERPLSPTDDLDAVSAQAREQTVLATALRTQLGLNLKSFPLETLVIDRAALPVDD